MHPSLSVVIFPDLNQFKDILLSVDIKLKDSEFKTSPVRALVDCCIRYRVEFNKLFAKCVSLYRVIKHKLTDLVFRDSKPVKAALPVSVSDLHSRYSHSGSKPSSSAKPASKR